MFTEVWVGNSGSSPTLSGLYAIAFVEDISRGEYTTVYNCRGLWLFGCTNIAQTNIGGSEAEWIMERPTVAVRCRILRITATATCTPQPPRNRLARG